MTYTKFFKSLNLSDNALTLLGAILGDNSGDFHSIVFSVALSIADSKDEKDLLEFGALHPKYMERAQAVLAGEDCTAYQLCYCAYTEALTDELFDELPNVLAAYGVRRILNQLDYIPLEALESVFERVVDIPMGDYGDITDYEAIIDRIAADIRGEAA